MPNRGPSKQDKVECFDLSAGLCHICKKPIDPLKEKWDAEHLIPRKLGGANKWPNLRPAHRFGCHSEKTKKDVKNIAEAVRRRAAHIGAKPEPKRPIKSAGFPKHEKQRIEKPTLPRRDIFSREVLR